MIRLVLTDFWLGWRLSFRASKRFGPMEPIVDGIFAAIVDRVTFNASIIETGIWS